MVAEGFLRVAVVAFVILVIFIIATYIFGLLNRFLEWMASNWKNAVIGILLIVIIYFFVVYLLFNLHL